MTREGILEDATGPHQHTHKLQKNKNTEQVNMFMNTHREWAVAPARGTAGKGKQQAKNKLPNF